MQLQEFVARHPGCEVERPERSGPLLAVGVPVVTALVLLWPLSLALAAGQWGGAALAATGMALLLWLASFGLPQLQAVLALHRRGHASFAVSEEDLLLVDSVGNALVIALDRVVSLEFDGADARVRIDEDDMQGVLYGMLFRLFDEEVPGPTAGRFFELLAPRLRASVPHAAVIRSE